MTVKVAINGFGRIGRIVFREAFRREGIEVVAINDLTDAKMLAHLLKYDSVHGIYDQEVHADGEDLMIGNERIRVYEETDLTKLPWKEHDVDVVIESTGLYRDVDSLQKHIDAGAKKVIVSAPGKGDMRTIVMGVNEDTYNGETDHILSNASCTTNCLAPVAKVLEDTFGIKRGLMTTVHAYTNDQRLLDVPHDDYRRARAAAESMIPTTTGAASAVTQVIPSLKGKLDGMAVRVPTPNVSMVDFVAELEKPVTVDEVNNALKTASETGSLAGVLEYSELPLVSIDYNGNAASSTVDAKSTMVIGEQMVKVLAWYDNETGYSVRCVDLVEYIAKKGL